MPEEYIPTTIPFTEAVEESNITQPPIITPPRKKFPVLISLLLMLLAFMATLGIYLFTQVRALNNQLTASPSPFVPQGNPVDSWRTYRVDGIELKIPPTWDGLGSSCQKIMITKSDASQLELPINDYIKQNEGFSDVTTMDSLISGVDPRLQITFKHLDPADIVTLGPLGEGELNNIYIKGVEGSGYYKINVIYAGPTPDSEGSCTGAKELEYQDVLSTLKFSEENTSNYVCPKTEWVDCMPGPNTGIKLECTQEYLTWAKTSCPGFKGAAL